MTHTQAEVDARALRAAGVPITLLDGREARLIFDLDAIAKIEEDFGSLGHFQEKLQEIDANGVNSAFFGPVLKMMRAALLHDQSAQNARFDSALVGEYFRAVLRAANLAFPKDEAAATTPTPQPTPQPTDFAAPQPIEPTTGFLGTSSTTQPQSDSVAPMPSSGE